MANHMQEVAKMLDVELGEEFVCSNGYQYILREDGVVDSNYGRFGGDTFSDVLNDLLTGKLVIKRNPWKPNNGDLCWSVLPDDDIPGWPWTDSTDDMNYYKLGNCYRTREEAEANRDKWITFYASDEVLEV